jgi:hypothetical protein
VIASVDGVVLCRVGDARLAVRCDEVEVIADAPRDGVDAGPAFGLARQAAGRSVKVGAHRLRVDSVDVVTSEGLAVLGVPLVVTGVAGGSLRGFIEVSGALWPLVSVPSLIEFVESLVEGAPS